MHAVAVHVARQPLQELGLGCVHVWLAYQHSRLGRSRWVMSTRRQIDSLRSGLSAGSAAAAAVADGSASGRLAAAVHDENERFIRSEGDRQQLLMQ